MRAAIVRAAPLTLASKALTAQGYCNGINGLIGVARVRLRLPHTQKVPPC